jgi:hypothetical protein
MTRIALVHCKHAIGWCYYGPIEGVAGTDWFQRLPCPCNDKPTVLAEFDALDLIRKLAPDGSVERGMQNE